MEQHVKIIGIVDIVFGSLSVFGGLIFMIMFLFLTPMIGASGEEGAAGAAVAMASVGFIGGIVVIAMGVFQIVVGIKLRAHKSWARIAQIVLGALNLPGFPIGTALGIYFIWAMTSNEAPSLFE